MADDVVPPKEIPGKHVSRLSTKLSLEDLNRLTPDIRKDLVENHGLEVRVISRSTRVQELLTKAGIAATPTEAAYDKVYDRTSPGYDRVYDRG